MTKDRDIGHCAIIILVNKIDLVGSPNGKEGDSTGKGKGKDEEGNKDQDTDPVELARQALDIENAGFRIWTIKVSACLNLLYSPALYDNTTSNADTYSLRPLIPRF
jgi:hypothetical protein